MENKLKLLKHMLIPFILAIIGLFFPLYMIWKEFRIEKMIIDQALQGNRSAIQILMKYEKPWKLDEKLVFEAIKGNQYALEVLKIDN